MIAVFKKLTVGDGERCMTKEDFLESGWFLDYPTKPLPEVTVAEKTVEEFKFVYDVLERIAEDGDVHEDWLDDVLVDFGKDDAKAKILEFENFVNEIFGRNPTYWEGKPVEIDMWPPKGAESE